MPPCFLGHIHGDVGAAHHAVQVGAVVGVHGDADRATGVDLDQALAERLAQPFDDAFSGGFQFPGLRLFLQHDEFVAAQAGQCLAGRQAG
ncbi:hypothetical protein D3C73_1427080 [compost metagenome]